jgi:aminoglycoside N3'-acetyltransferase
LCELECINLMLDKILSFNPWIEVFIKWIYWRSSNLRKLIQPLLKKIRRGGITQLTGAEDLEQLKLLISEFNISPDDILLVHSSFTDLRLGSASPEELLTHLLAQVVPEGTLVLPAMPIMKDVSGNVTDYPGDPSNIAIFDVKKSIPWTGILSRKFLRYPGAIRWVNPVNNLVAAGVHAKEMFSNNFFDKDMLDLFPSGKGSPWEFMVKKNTKILSLGTDLVHSLTMIHYVEDAMGLSWPILNWYRKRKFVIRADGLDHEVELNERDPRWAINFAERTLRKDLLNTGLLKSKRINGAKVEFIETEDLVNFLNSKNANGYPYFTFSTKQ